MLPAIEVRDTRGGLLGLVDSGRLPCPFFRTYFSIAVRPPTSIDYAHFKADAPISPKSFHFYEIQLEWREFISGECLYPCVCVSDRSIPHLGFWPHFRFTEIAGSAFVQSPKWAVFVMMDKGWRFTPLRRAA